MTRAALALYALYCMLPSSARAFCPCYTLSSQYNSYSCGVEAAPGTNPTVAQWQPVFDLVCRGPAAWGDAGPTVGQIGQGCGKPEPTHDVDASFPVELLKGIAMNESGWRQFCHPDQPADQGPDPERTIISFDCGYGVGQVTSGMHKGETPAYDRARVAGDPTYNLATGTQILAAKWRATRCVGDNQPKIVEDWYTATWAYNGLVYANNPNNPNLDPVRPPWDPKVGGAYAYQERVFGWIEHPPSPSHWPSVALAYPDRADVGGAGAPPDLPEPACAGPTDCANQRAVHATACGAGPPMPDMAMAAADGAAATADLAAANSGDAGAATLVQSGCGCGVGGRASPPFWIGVLWMLR